MPVIQTKCIVLATRILQDENYTHMWCHILNIAHHRLVQRGFDVPVVPLSC